MFLPEGNYIVIFIVWLLKSQVLLIAVHLKNIREILFINSVHRKYNGSRPLSWTLKIGGRDVFIIVLLGRIVIIHTGNVVEIKTDSQLL